MQRVTFRYKLTCSKSVLLVSRLLCLSPCQLLALPCYVHWVGGLWASLYASLALFFRWLGRLFVCQLAQQFGFVKASCSRVAPTYARGPGCLRPMGLLLVCHQAALLPTGSRRCPAAAAADIRRPVLHSCVSKADPTADQSSAKKRCQFAEIFIETLLG